MIVRVDISYCTTYGNSGGGGGGRLMKVGYTSEIQLFLISPFLILEWTWLVRQKKNIIGQTYL